MGNTSEKSSVQRKINLQVPIRLAFHSLPSFLGKENSVKCFYFATGRYLIHPPLIFATQSLIISLLIFNCIEQLNFRTIKYLIWRNKRKGFKKRLCGRKVKICIKIWYRWHTDIFPNFWCHFTEFHIIFEILTEVALGRKTCKCLYWNLRRK